MKCPLEIHTGSIEGKERVYKNHILVQTPTCKASQTIEEKKNAEMETVIEKMKENRRRLWE